MPITQNESTQNESAQNRSSAAGTAIPVLHTARVVPRTRLTDVLDHELFGAGGTTSIVLVCAPAGSGKTTFLADWARRALHTPNRPNIAWTTVREEHNSPHLLRGELERALAAVDRSAALATSGTGTRPTRGPVISPPLAPDASVAPVWLVLDDAHLLHDVGALSALETLLRAPPERLRVVVCGRFEPPLAFQKLRLDGRVLDVTAADLAFTAEEAAALLAEHGVELSSTDLSALMERTEGWAAGLRLAGMSLAGHPSPTTLIENFTGCRRAVADYLIEQVLAGQSAETRRFLLETSVPATFSAALAEELTGCADAHAILDRLEHRNFLISRIETTPTLFRYHPLLRGYLRAEISLLGRRAVADLEHAAARWYARFGDALPALEHGVTAGAVADVEGVLRESGLALVLDGHGEAVERLVSAAPPPIRDARIARLVRAAAHLHADNYTVAGALLGPVDDRPPDARRDPRADVLEEALRLQAAARVGDDEALRGQRTRSETDGSGDLLLEAFAGVQRGRGHLHVGRLDAAAQSLRRARAHAREIGSPLLAAQASTALGVVALRRGRLDDARRLASDSRIAAGEAGPGASVDARRAMLLEALCHYLRHDTERALELVGGAHGSGRPGSGASTVASALFAVDGAPDRRSAVAALHTAATAAGPGTDLPGLAAAWLPSVQFAYLRIGETTWARELVADASAQLGRTGDIALLGSALLLHDNRAEQARTALAPVLAGEAPCAAATNTVTAWLLEADLCRRRGHEVRAHDALAEALRLAEPEGVLRPFHDMPFASLELLTAHRGRFGPRDSFADAVWTSLPRPTVGTAEQLTRRELQLLAELPTWRTAEEIAADLCVSVNTVKTHLRGIYRKLGVTTRRGAVAAAHTHGLL